MSHQTSSADGPVEIVTFSPHDPDNPKFWSKNYKRLNVALLCFLVFIGVLGSSFYAPAEAQMQRKYGISPDVNSLGLSLYVLGFAAGPLLCPMGEMYGRRLPYLIAWPLLIVFLAFSAWIDNAAVIILFRFFAGAASSAPLTNGAACTIDLYSQVDLEAQGIASSYFTFSGFCGPVVAPVVGFFLSTRFPNELWVLRLHFFLAVATYPVVLMLPETHGPTILAARAKALRKSGHPRAFAPQEISPKTTAQIMRTNLTRPALMLIKEPIVIGASVWMSLSYGILYFAFQSYPVIFLQQHKIPARFGGLPFIPIVIGMALSVIPYVPLVRFFQKMKLPAWMGDANDSESPEARLKLALLACVCLPISSFWLAWSSGSETHWIVPVLSGIPFGFANLAIFFTFLTYLAHTYSLYTASAVAINTFVRSVVAAIFPMISHSILDRLGTKWGISLFGFLSLGLIPIPIIFLRNGKRLRGTSHFSREALALMLEMESQSRPDSEKTVEAQTTDKGISEKAGEKRTPVPTVAGQNSEKINSQFFTASRESSDPDLKALEEGGR